MYKISAWLSKYLTNHRTIFVFLSGMHFSQAVAIIQSQVGVIKGVQVLYSETVSQSFVHFLVCLQHLMIYLILFNRINHLLSSTEPFRC